MFMKIHKNKKFNTTLINEYNTYQKLFFNNYIETYFISFIVLDSTMNQFKKLKTDLSSIQYKKLAAHYKFNVKLIKNVQKKVIN